MLTSCVIELEQKQRETETLTGRRLMCLGFKSQHQGREVPDEEHTSKTRARTKPNNWQGSTLH